MNTLLVGVGAAPSRSLTDRLRKLDLDQRHHHALAKHVLYSEVNLALI